MARLVAIGSCFIATVVCVVGAAATGSGQAVRVAGAVRTAVGPTRLVSPGFGYSGRLPDV